ncbi:hypothetical protein DEA98_10095 [Brucella pseudogrignonensis]|uniref:Uncharacterized protein n=1 Tax=Brucella pseudogrignonensis TaxID=419475 RepID=A0A7Y3T8C5_9HYPH|nr:hypothetical protein [Brucella pseudogrignonensis]MCM0751548.1 hypothetical protein [Brucella pseudogrignonensis]NNV22055.1 hypothetical protein [Brucella pseudogrignonensis]
MPHTQGPWEVDDFPLDVEHACTMLKVDANTPREWVGICTPRDADGNYEHVAYCHISNAPVIAASTEMLAALEKAEAFIAGFEGDELQENIGELLNETRAAIAKARGG